MRTIKNIWNFIKGIPSTNTHQKNLIWVPLILALLIAMPTGTFFGLWCMFVIGICMELMYCFGATKNVSVWIFRFDIWDLSATIDSIKRRELTTRHRFNDKNIWYVCVGATIFLALRWIF